MSDYVKIASGVADQYLTALAESQETFLKSVTAFAAKTPVAALPTPPFAVELPTPREVAEANFAFATKLLKQQKAFTDKLFAASASAS